jgi:integrase
VVVDLQGTSGLGHRPIAEIAAPEILKALRVEELAGRYETAIRLRESIGQVFRLAIASGRATSDPTGDMRRALGSPTVTNRAAILDPKRLGDLLRAMDDYETSRARSEVVTAMSLWTASATRPGGRIGSGWCPRNR